MYNVVNILGIVVFILFDGHVNSENVLVNTTSGLVMGKIVSDDIIDVTYKAFVGIPYAEPPIGDLRFRPPIPIKYWTNILNATAPGYACPQSNVFNIKEGMNENCLFLNIFVPANRPVEKFLPVMIFIYGGDFRLGTSNPDDIYGPQLFLKSDIVVATMNYRLGSLGFLSLLNKDAPGNAGIKDVLLAVQWIHDNIHKFGGDPNRTTISGQSAGAVITQYLMLTDKASGLFQRAILSSGSILSYKFIQKDPRENARILGEELGLTWSNDSCLLQQLKEIEPLTLVAAEERIIMKDPRRAIVIYSPFSPCIEKKSLSAIVTEEPSKLIEAGKIINIPTIIGFNNQEGLEIFAVLKLNPSAINKFNENFELAIPSDIEYPVGSHQRRKLASSIRDFYFYGGNISIYTAQNYINLVTDAEFVYSIDHLVDLLQKRKNSAPLYYYVFTFDGQLNLYKKYENITFPGASHGDEIGYVFVPSILRAQYNKTDCRTKDVLNTIQKLLTNFIKYGNPTPRGVCNVISWPETGEFRRHLVIDEQPRVVWHEPNPERTSFWRSMYEDYTKYKTGSSV